ncbi:MAG TPA: hypothetical protein VKB80_13745, partial [Kofleriaceae bacterium]|nr:hypothetical protein [Kofleriaceae bacterium]
MSLGQYLYPADRVTDPFPTIGWCANAGSVVDTRYMVAELPAQGAHLSVLAMTLPNADGDCELLRGRTIARVDIIEAKTEAKTEARARGKKPARAKRR